MPSLTAWIFPRFWVVSSQSISVQAVFSETLDNARAILAMEGQNTIQTNLLNMRLLGLTKWHAAKKLMVDPTNNNKRFDYHFSHTLLKQDLLSSSGEHWSTMRHIFNLLFCPGSYFSSRYDSVWVQYTVQQKGVTNLRSITSWWPLRVLSKPVIGRQPGNALPSGSWSATALKIVNDFTDSTMPQRTTQLLAGSTF